MIDLQLQDTVQGADIVVNGKNVELSGGWQTMVYLALFGGNVGAVTAERAPEEIAEDWFANALLFDGEPAKQFNSRTQKALTSGAIGSNAEQVVKQAIEKDLAFVTSFANLEVEVNAKSFAELEVYIALQEKANLESKRFQFIWNNTEQEIKGLTVEEPDTTEYEDFQFTGDPTTSAGGTKTQTYIFTFEPNSFPAFGQYIFSTGDILQITNRQDVKLYRNTSQEPFKEEVGIDDRLSYGDYLTVEKINKNITEPLKVEVLLNYTNVNINKESFVDDVSDRHRYMFALNEPGNFVEVVDLPSETVINTINLPTDGKPYNRPLYRPYDRKVWLFGNEKLFKIKADPINNWLQTENLSWDNEIKAAAYKPFTDSFCLTSVSGRGTHIYKPKTGNRFYGGYDPFQERGFKSLIRDLNNIPNTNLFFMNGSFYRSRGFFIFDEEFNVTLAGDAEITKFLDVVPKNSQFLIKPGTYGFAVVGTETDEKYRNFIKAQYSRPTGAGDPRFEPGIRVDPFKNIGLGTRFNKKGGMGGLADFDNYTFTALGNGGLNFGSGEFELDSVFSSYTGKIYQRLSSRNSGSDRYVVSEITDMNTNPFLRFSSISSIDHTNIQRFFKHLCLNGTPD